MTTREFKLPDPGEGLLEAFPAPEPVAERLLKGLVGVAQHHALGWYLPWTAFRRVASTCV